MLEYLIFSFVIPLAFFAKPSKTDFNGYVGYNIQMLARGNVKYEKEVKKQKKETEKREKERDRIEKELGIVRC